MAAASTATTASFISTPPRPCSPLLRMPLQPEKSAPRAAAAVSCTLTRAPAAVEAPALRLDSFGRFGRFGGKYVPETLMHALTELETAFHALAKDDDFQVRVVHSETATLKDATSEAIGDWVTNVKTTHCILGSVVGPHPYPMMVRDFHAILGKETRKQAMEKWGGKPDVLVACVEGGSNATGLFHEFVDDEDVGLISVEAAGCGTESGKHAATLTKGEVGVLHGAMSYLLQDDDGQIIEPHSISAGLDYPGVGPRGLGR